MKLLDVLRTLDEGQKIEVFSLSPSIYYTYKGEFNQSLEFKDKYLNMTVENLKILNNKILLITVR